MKQIANSHRKGRCLEEAVEDLLSRLKHSYPDRVRFDEQPRISLQSGEVVVPDFDLRVRLPFTRLHYFIECQDRKRKSKDILHKVLYVRDKQWRNTFVYVCRTASSAATLDALKREGVMVFELELFQQFIEKLRNTLAAIELNPDPYDLDLGPQPAPGR